ncbi:Na+/H+ antiporter family protein [Helicobacter pylori]|uniref:Na+/H+ antiporter family protein n=1 Tax=Helicobacter pylori HP260AFii TaxID=1159077 RepID=A0ABC9S9U5_HELPX|nr:Na+/H+ antiporter family protein [Helicobacter pylori]EMH19847.1 Na+/H+ antiporter family protein [Helicobacter pylori GAM260ASi]EMH27481.1 Na+/H+ antiporter family protein [Helicobacter pylori GAM268Bii]EMH64292.1 Na+/H+ antiporter family protein [Helicobacter pylori HP260AFi]EMH66783.1 Na+/H+ antiporter family protein [Helicobacter pylori HP260ASii]EMH66882.1 Na+/H+ antiporter family protein [Helicobacter pylori HP260AFii]
MLENSSVWSNPAFVAIICMCVLSLLRLNVMLSMISATLIAGLMGGLGITESFNVMIDGMKGNLNIALSYILLGALAVAIAKSNLIKVALNKLIGLMDYKRSTFCFLIAFIACFSQNLVPVHIAFIPILIPPLLHLMNRLELDRRAVACALTFGLQAPYLVLPVGFGLIFQTTILEQLKANGVSTTIAQITGVMWIAGLAMVVGLFLAVLTLYKKPRRYQEKSFNIEDYASLQLNYHDYLTFIGIVVAFVIQLATDSMPLAAFLALAIILLGRGIKFKETDSLMDDSVKMMAFIAFVMLVASGFGEVLQKVHAIDGLVNAITSVIQGKLLGAFLMLVVGLFITMGIGTSFGTIPIIAVFYVPLCAKLGFSTESTILLIGIAAALGDAGSPASDSTMGPTCGLNADNQHNHIYDTCVPTFLVYNLPLIVFGVVGALLLG